MTTLDVGISGPNGSIDMSNGLLGSATSVFFAACEAHRAGKAEGTSGAAGCDLKLKGSVLLEFLPAAPPGLVPRYSSTGEEIRHFHDTIDPDADYYVGAIEV